MPPVAAFFPSEISTNGALLVSEAVQFVAAPAAPVGVVEQIVSIATVAEVFARQLIVADFMPFVLVKTGFGTGVTQSAGMPVAGMVRFETP